MERMNDREEIENRQEAVVIRIESRAIARSSAIASS